MDLIFLGLTLSFFVLSVCFVYGCEKLGRPS